MCQVRLSLSTNSSALSTHSRFGHDEIIKDVLLAKNIVEGSKVIEKPRITRFPLGRRFRSIVESRGLGKIRTKNKPKVT